MQKRSLLYIGNKLSKRGGTVTTIDTLAPLLRGEDFLVYTASSKKNKVLRMLDMLLSILRLSRKISLVLIDTYSTQNFYYALWTAKLCSLLGIPYIPILHGGNLPERLEKSPKLSKNLFKKAKINVSPSKYLMRAFKEKGFDNITHIPNSIEISKYPFFLRKEIMPSLLWVRSFAEIYNPMLAIELIKELHEKGIEATLTMVGPEKDGSLIKCQTEAEKHGLPIVFTGKLEKLQWVTLSREHDIFINTTNFDNMPVSVIEAAALGMPIVSTDVGGVPYLIENNVTGLLVPPNNIDAFQQAISRLLKDSLLVETLSKNARASAEAFDWQKVKISWLGLID